jgi:hypothetical protein
MCFAFVSINFAFVDVDTFDQVGTISKYFCTFETFACKARILVVTKAVGWAVVSAVSTLIDIMTSSVDIMEAVLAAADVALYSVDAYGVVGADEFVCVLTFIDVATCEPVAFVSKITVAFVVTLGVDAVSIVIADVTSLDTFVDIGASTVDVGVPVVTEAVVAAVCVEALGVCAATCHASHGTFVDVVAVVFDAAPLVALVAFAFPTSYCVQAVGVVNITVVRVIFAFVEVFTVVYSIANITVIADTAVAPFFVSTGGVFVAVEGV